MTELKPKSGIMEINAYVGGNAGLETVGEVINIASNENPLGPSPRALTAHKEASEALHLYPDGGSSSLRAALADHYGLPAQQIVCGAGSDELLTLLARAFAGPGDEIIHSAHGFLMYPIAAWSVGARPVAAPEIDLTADVDAMIELANARTRIVYLANPNNPTGTYIPADAVERLRQGLPEDTLLVLDAAYAEYVTRNDYEPGTALVEKYDNVVMARTFSKIYGLASLRVGWVYCPDYIADVLNRIRSPFNVGGPGIAAATAAVADIGHTDRARALNDEMLPWFSEACAALGLEPIPSVGNFVLVRFPRRGDNDGPTVAAAAHGALHDGNIWTRAMGAYGLPDCIRFTIGKREDMAKVVDILAAFMGQGNG